MADALSAWLAVRERLDWAAACAPPLRAAPGPDGVAVHLASTVEPRDPARAARLRTALARARADADRGAALTLLRLARWQQLALGLPSLPGFRAGPAFAKDGRERYGLHPETARRFAACLAEADPPEPPDPSELPELPGLPPAARAARAFLDVAFFHPFDDGNARLALLTLDFVLRRESLRVGAAGPLLVLRPAGDAVATAAFVRLVSLLVSPV